MRRMARLGKRAIKAMLQKRGLVKQWALRLKASKAWRCADKSAHARALQMLSDNYGGGRSLDLDDALLACEVAGEDPLSSLSQAAAQRGEEEALRAEALVQGEQDAEAARRLLAARPFRLA